MNGTQRQNTRDVLCFLAGGTVANSRVYLVITQTYHCVDFERLRANATANLSAPRCSNKGTMNNTRVPWVYTAAASCTAPAFLLRHPAE